MGLIASGTEANLIDRPGGIFIRRSEEVEEEGRILFQAVARVILLDTAETLAEQADRQWPVSRRPKPFVATRALEKPRPEGAPPPPDLGDVRQ